jgi:hypothetical protein
VRLLNGYQSLLVVELHSFISLSNPKCLGELTLDRIWSAFFLVGAIVKNI